MNEYRSTGGLKKKGDNFTADIALKRTITDIGSFDVERIELTKSNNTSMLQTTWNGMVTDNVNNDSYNTFEYIGAPVLSLDEADANYQQYSYGVTCGLNKVTFNLDYLYRAMKLTGLHSLTIPIKLTFNDSLTEGQLVWRKNILLSGVNNIKLDLLYRPFDQDKVV